MPTGYAGARRLDDAGRLGVLIASLVPLRPDKDQCELRAKLGPAPGFRMSWLRDFL